MSDMFLFNDLIQHLDLIDIPFEGRQFTWSNMQSYPLLEKTRLGLYIELLVFEFPDYQSFTTL